MPRLAAPPSPCRLLVAVVATTLCAATLAPRPAGARPPTAADLLASRTIPAQEVRQRLASYREVDLGVDISPIDKRLVPMLAPLRMAADYIDRVYWRQVSAEGLGWLETLQAVAAAGEHAEAGELAALMRIHYGPWDRHHGDRAFVGRQARPSGAGFYPADVSQREIEAWLHSEPSKAAAVWSPYTIVQRAGDKLKLVPYAKAYQQDLTQAAKALRLAADTWAAGAPKEGASKDGERTRTIDCDGFVRYLRARADSLLDDRYLTSEILWLETGTCPIDIAIGPYEFYEDRLLGVKAAFEAIIYYRDDGESARFRRFLDKSEELLKALPIPETLRPRFELVKPSPVTIADVLYTAGDARAGFQIRAFVLPNDEAVRVARGTKNVILKNVVRAKFDALTLPVARRIFGPKLVGKVSFQAYYDLLLMWQLAHIVEPREIEQRDGSKTTSRKLLQARYTLMNQVLSEVVALLNWFHLRDSGALRGRADESMALTWLASLVDAARLSEGSPQTVSKAILYNYFAQEWVTRYNPGTRTFEVNPPAMRKAVEKLAAELLQIIGRGDYEGAGRLIVQYGILPGEVRAKLNELADVPVDIMPHYSAMGSGSCSACKAIDKKRD